MKKRLGLHCIKFQLKTITIITTPIMLDLQKILLFSLLCTGFACYTLFLYNSLENVTDLESDMADAGKKVWQENNCIACHQIYQLGGYLGPDLTNCYATKGPEYIKAFVQNGTLIMPKFDLTATELEALVAYLKQIDATGNADPRSFKIMNNGMISQQ